MVGYSGTPLGKKLGIKPGVRMLTIAAPEEYASWVGELPPGAAVGSKIDRPDGIHLFVRRRKELEKQLARLRKSIAPDAFVWVSWPKKAARVETDVTEDVIRDVALPLGFVDVKVCAVSEIWSGLKLVLRLSERPAAH